METSLEGQELLLHTHTETPLHIQTDILFLVFVCDFYLLSVWLEVVMCDASKLVMINRKRLIKDTLNVILSAVRGRGRGREGEKERGEGRRGEGGRGEGERE